eukprot:Gb_16962 [translate_table: standard]
MSSLLLPVQHMLNILLDTSLMMLESAIITMESAFMTINLHWRYWNLAIHHHGAFSICLLSATLYQNIANIKDIQKCILKSIEWIYLKTKGSSKPAREPFDFKLLLPDFGADSEFCLLPMKVVGYYLVGILNLIGIGIKYH